MTKTLLVREVGEGQREIKCAAGRKCLICSKASLFLAVFQN
jgi:hypothetical protein